MVEMAQSVAEEQPEQAAQLIAEVLKRAPDHAGALAFQAKATPA